jgi:trigger factor
MEAEATVECKLCKSLKVNINRVSSNLVNADITVPAGISNKIFKYATDLYCNHAKATGLDDRKLPEEYVATHYSSAIHDSSCYFLLKFIVMDFLTRELKLKKFPIAHHPRLENIDKRPDGGLIFKFRIAIISGLKTENWKLLNFSPPRRKLYKDLDRQAKSFLEQEAENKQDKEENWLIGGEDWICFKATLINKSKKKQLRDHMNSFWMKISTKYLVSQFQNLFIGKKIGDSFITNTLPVEDMQNDALSAKGTFSLEVQSISKGGYFSLDLFKSAFRLSGDKDVHEKLIEIFSYRNDISQRRSIIEEAFRQLLSRSRFEIPRHLVLRRQELLLLGVRKLPDYHVYKAQENFISQLSQLAEKQLKEEILIDKIAQEENIFVTSYDIREYLNLFVHERLREFIYFRPIMEDFTNSSIPVREEEFAEIVVREKTLNAVIRALSRKTRTC